MLILCRVFAGPILLDAYLWFLLPSLKIAEDTPLGCIFDNDRQTPNIQWVDADDETEGVPTKTKTGVTVITPSTQSIRRTKTTTWCQTYRAAPNPFWHVSGGASISGSALPQVVNASTGGSGVSTIGRFLLSAANGVADHHHHLLRRVMAK